MKPLSEAEAITVVLAVEIDAALIVALVVVFLGTLISLLAWLAVQQYETHATIAAELKPNGGGSIKDAVHQLEQGQVTLSNQIESLRATTANYETHAEEIKVLKLSQAKVLARLDDLSNQMAGDTAKVIQKLDP